MGTTLFAYRLRRDTAMQAQAAAGPATPQATVDLVALRRFEAAIQSLLDVRLDDATVLVWTRLRSIRPV